ncbi:recombinase family protein [uncultured Methylobacterium sp.]|uniref:recombinase family protein n=1 Tax=uncultured Methylobacterium sp. TaxID=157278 RepID=UPI0035CB0403
MTVYGYDLVETDGQTLDAQLEGLQAAGCEKVFRDTVGGARADRQQLARLLERTPTKWMPVRRRQARQNKDLEPCPT